MPSTSSTTCGRRDSAPPAVSSEMWPSPCSPTSTLPSASEYQRSSGLFSPEASSSTGSADATPAARGRAAGCAHGSGDGDGEGDSAGLGLAAGVAFAEPPEPMVHPAVRQTATASAARDLVRIADDVVPCAHPADGGVPAV